MGWGEAIAMVGQFATRSGKSAFSNLTSSRRDFANALMERINSPSLINQQDASLCGPGCFIYCLARKDPMTYARYAIDLYETGRAMIGSLVVKPSADCKAFSPLPGRYDIKDVDWVALASLRDASQFQDYQSPNQRLAGITLPSDLAFWFKRTIFSHMANQTNLFFDKDLFTLLGAHQKFLAGHYVCLFIGADLLEGRRNGQTTIPDHWVVLASQIRVNGTSATTLLARGAAVNGDRALLDATVEFDVYTWGTPMRAVTQMWPGIRVKDCLDFFYGFVSAK